MSADTSRKAYRYTCNMIRPQMYSEKSLMESVVDFFSDVVPTAYTGAQKNEDKEKIQWVRFENSDCNDVSKNPDMFRSETKGMPLLLILGYSNGVQIWHVTPNGEAQEVLSVRQGPVRICRILPNPDQVLGHGDGFSTQRPLIVLCDSSSAGTPYCAVKFVSLKSGDEVHSISYKNLPVQSVECNKRFVLSVFLEKVCVYEACQFQQLFWITSCFPCPGPNVNPVALSTRWLAYADKRLVAMHQSCGGMSGDGSQSYAATVISAAKGAFKGLSMFGEAMVSSVTGCKSSPPKRDYQQLDNGNRPGIVTVVDLQNIHNDHFNVNEDNEGTGLIAHFHAHANEPVACMAFDPTGTLLVTSCKLGHNFHVFRLMAHPVSSCLGAVHHLYTLHRGDTTAKVIDISFNHDSRWITVSSHRGTTHLFPITPYGGPVNIRTHCKPHVVNRASRFHRSAGLDEIDHTVGRRSPVLSTSPGSSGQHDRYPTLIQQNTLNNNMGNPRLPPYPHPITIYPAYQVKQPLNVALNPGNKNQSPVHSTARSDNVYSVCAKFCTPRLCVVGSPKLERRDGGKRPVDSLFVMAQSGTLVEYVLEPRAKSVSDKVTDDCLLELNVTGRMQWNLQRLKNSQELRPPLPSNSPVILAHEAIVSQTPTALDLFDLPGLTRHDSKDSLSSDHSSKDDSDEQWLSQVEIITHAGPHRRLWMGPQFSFKTYQENTTVLSSNSSSLLSQSPESNMVAMDMLGDDMDLESLNIQTMRSNPVSMPNARPAYRRLSGSDSSPSTVQGVGAQSVPLLIEAGSFEQSPQLQDVFSNWTESSVAKQPRGSDDLEEDRLKETLADAMVESPCKDIDKLSLRNQDNPRASVKSRERMKEKDRRFLAKTGAVDSMKIEVDKSKENPVGRISKSEEKCEQTKDKLTGDDDKEAGAKEVKKEAEAKEVNKKSSNETQNIKEKTTKPKKKQKQSKSKESIKDIETEDEPSKTAITQQNTPGNAPASSSLETQNLKKVDKKDVKSISVKTKSSDDSSKVKTDNFETIDHNMIIDISSSGLPDEHAKVSCSENICDVSAEPTEDQLEVKVQKHEKFESKNELKSCVKTSSLQKESSVKLKDCETESMNERDIQVIDKTDVGESTDNSGAIPCDIDDRDEETKSKSCVSNRIVNMNADSIGLAQRSVNDDDMVQSTSQGKSKSKRRNGKKNNLEYDERMKSMDKDVVRKVKEKQLSTEKHLNIADSGINHEETPREEVSMKISNTGSKLEIENVWQEDKNQSKNPKDSDSEKVQEEESDTVINEENTGEFVSVKKGKPNKKKRAENLQQKGNDNDQQKFENKIHTEDDVSTFQESNFDMMSEKVKGSILVNLSGKSADQKEFLTEMKAFPKLEIEDLPLPETSTKQEKCIVELLPDSKCCDTKEDFKVVSKKKQKKKKNGMEKSVVDEDFAANIYCNVGENTKSIQDTGNILAGSLDNVIESQEKEIVAENTKIQESGDVLPGSLDNVIESQDKEIFSATAASESLCVGLSEVSIKDNKDTASFEANDDFGSKDETDDADEIFIKQESEGMQAVDIKFMSEAKLSFSSKTQDKDEDMFTIQKKKNRRKKKGENTHLSSGRSSSERETAYDELKEKDGGICSSNEYSRSSSKVAKLDEGEDYGIAFKRDIIEIKANVGVPDDKARRKDEDETRQTDMKENDVEMLVIDEKKMEDSAESGSKYETAESAEDDPSAWERAEFVECVEEAPSSGTITESRDSLVQERSDVFDTKGVEDPIKTNDEYENIRTSAKEAMLAVGAPSVIQMSTYVDESTGSSSRSSEERDSGNAEKGVGQKNESKSKKKKRKNRK